MGYILASMRRSVIFAVLATPLPALADTADAPIIGIAALPRDLSPWGMFLSADPVVKGVLIGLAFASVVTWTVWLAKTIEILRAKQRVRAAVRTLSNVRSTSEGIERLAGNSGEVGQFLDAAATELQISAGLHDRDGIKERHRGGRFYARPEGARDREPYRALIGRPRSRRGGAGFVTPRAAVPPLPKGAASGEHVNLTVPIRFSLKKEPRKDWCVMDKRKSLAAAEPENRYSDLLSLASRELPATI
jgi:hypothetical protein